MQTLRIETRSNRDGVLRLDIPVEAVDADFEVFVVYQAKSANGRHAAKNASAWPSGFIESTAGAWQGEFVREQGEYEKREEL